MNGKKAGVVLGYLAMVLQNASSFILIPLLMIGFGDGNFGVYRLILSISSYFALADLGLSNAIVRYVSEYKANNDKLSEGKFISLIIIVDLIAGTVLIFLGTILYINLPLLFESSFTNSELNLLKKMFFLTLLNGVINLLVNLANGIIKSYEYFGLLKTLNIIITIVRFVMVLLLITFKLGAFSLVLLDTLLSVFLLLLTSVFCYKKLKIKLAFKQLSKDYAIEILSYSMIVFVDVIAFHLFWNADNFIIGVYLSSSAIAIYSIGTQISSLFFAISIIVSDVIMPGLVKQVTDNASNTDLTLEMIKIGRIKLIILALPVIGFIFLGKEFIILWVGKEYIIAYWIALLVIIPSTIAGVFDAGLYVMWAKNKHKIKSFVSLAISGVNIIISIVLVQNIGIIGAAVGTSFAYIVGYNIFNTVYFHKALKLDMFKFMSGTLKSIWIPIFITFIFTYFVTGLPSTSLVFFMFKVFIISLVYFVLVLKMAFNDYEKNLFASMLQKFKYNKM